MRAQKNATMFNKNFYPTPANVREEMLKHINLFDGASILDPSAGKGDLLSGFSPHKYNIYAIEIEPELRAILKDKKIEVIGENFLAFAGKRIFDIIIMNPPFDQGPRHLLKAWDIVQPGGQIVSLLNETSLNQNTKEKQLLAKVIEENGYTIELGDCFLSAERTTNVNVILVALTKPSDDSDILAGLTGRINKRLFEPDFDNTPEENLPAPRNLIKSYVDQFERIQELYIEYRKIQKAFFDYSKSMMDTEALIRRANDRYVKSDNEILSIFNKEAWNVVFEKTELSALLTSQAREKFYKSQDQQSKLNFNYENIMEFMSMIHENRMEIILQCIEDTFDTLVRYDRDNVVYTEGWATNSHYKVNKKVILPLFSIHSYFFTNTRVQEAIEDLDKCLCYLNGGRPDQPGFVSAMNALMESHREKLAWCNDSTHFEIKRYKKGTVHLTFKDLELLDRFNQEVAKRKGWLKQAGRR